MNEATPRGLTVRRELTAQEMRQSSETQMAAVAAREKALVEAQFIVAERHPRNWDDVRVQMLKHCARTRFAELARYSRPVGKEFVNGEWVDKRAEGFTTRFTEILAQEMGNIKLTALVTYEDDSTRIVRFSVLDLENNLVKERDVSISKTVERKGVRGKGGWEPPKGRDVIAERINSQGEPTYLVRATPEELRAKTNAEESRSQRDFITRLCPRDILEDCEQAVMQTLAADQQRDPTAYLKRVLDSFAAINIRPSDLEAYIGYHSRQWSPRDIEDLRGLYAAIRDGHTTFQEALAVKYGPAEEESPAEETPAQRHARLHAQMEAQRQQALNRINQLKQQQQQQARPSSDFTAEDQEAHSSSDFTAEDQEAHPVLFSDDAWRSAFSHTLSQLVEGIPEDRAKSIIMNALGRCGYESIEFVQNQDEAALVIDSVREQLPQDPDDSIKRRKRGFGR